MYTRKHKNEIREGFAPARGMTILYAFLAIIGLTLFLGLCVAVYMWFAMKFYYSWTLLEVFGQVMYIVLRMIGNFFGHILDNN